jgi:hypothetical protein
LFHGFAPTGLQVVATAILCEMTKDGMPNSATHAITFHFMVRATLILVNVAVTLVFTLGARL